MNQILTEKKQNLNAKSTNLNHSGLGMLVVIDRNVDDISTLVNGVLAGAKVLVLNSGTDSIEQITRALAEETFNSLHIVSHGAPGVLYLGNNPLTLDNLNHYSYLLQEWGVPEILLYGCNVAAGDSGEEFLGKLQRITGANIHASTTKVGHASLGGNWELDTVVYQYSQGQKSPIELLPFTNAEDWMGTLVPDPAGTLDTSFSTDGFDVQDLQPGSYSSEKLNHVTVQPDGKIVASGAGRNDAFEDLYLMRYNSDGTLDTSFGTGGSVIQAVPSGFGSITQIDGLGHTVQADGKIIVVGSVSVAGVAGSHQSAIARYNADGTIDTTFGTGGFTVRDFNGSTDMHTGVTLTSTNQILATINIGGYGGSMAIARYNSDGTLDTTFGTNGVVTRTMSGSAPSSPHDDQLVMLPNDAFIVAGTSGGDVVLERFNADGSLDTGFGTGGTVTVDFGTTENVVSLDIQSDGKLIVGLEVNDGTKHFGAARFNADGTADTSFGTAGLATVTPSSDNYTRAAKVMPNDKIALVGIVSNASHDMAVAVLNSDGSLDTSYGTDGITSVDISSGDHDQPFGAAVQSDNSVIVVGFTNSGYNLKDVAILRLAGEEVNNHPTDLDLSASSIDENVAANSVVGTLSSSDPDTGNTFTYSLVDGTGSTDNSAFTISGNELLINDSPDFETQNSYSIRVQTTDQDGLSFEKALTIEVNDLYETPTITGTPEDDFLEGTPEGEIITGLAGSDFLIGEGGDDLIEGGEDFDFIEAGDGNDTVDGGGSDDLMTGDAGDDLMLASPGFDFFDGGVGEDTADYSNIGEAIIFDAQTLVDKGTAGIDEIFEVETIIGATDAANKIDGSTGVNDTNSLSVDLTANILTVDDGVEPKNYTIENFVDVTGTPLNDSIAGNDADNTFLGNDGDDIFVGSLGNDKFDGGVGEDTADYSNLDAAVTFNAQTEVNKGSNGVDEVLSLETIIGASGQANTIDGSTEVNDGNSFSVDLSANSLIVDDGTTSITYTVENFLNVSGNSEADSLIGNDGDNILDGGAGSDRLTGKAGADTLIGVDAASTTPGAGERDRLRGGADADVFVLGDANGVFYLDEAGSYGRRGIAMILDFESGVDKIQLSGVADDYITRGSYIFADEGSRDGVLDRGDDMIAYARGGFDADDFMFVS